VEFTFGSQTIRINMPSQTALLAEITRRFRAGDGFSLATINLDHLVKLSSDADFARVYAGQDLIVADGRPIVWLSRVAGREVELVPGSDLVHPLAGLTAAEGMPVALVGSSEIALRDAVNILKSKHDGLNVVVALSPAYGFDPDGEEAADILRQLTESGARLCFIALGAPKQESFAARGRTEAPAVGFASIGAGLDFLGGHQRRAPGFMRAIGMEWLWRALSDPIRLVPRYAKCFAILPRQLMAARKLKNVR